MMQFYLYLVEIDNNRSKRGYYAFQTVETSETAAIFGRNVVVRYVRLRAESLHLTTTLRPKIAAVSDVSTV